MTTGPNNENNTLDDDFVPEAHFLRFPPYPNLGAAPQGPGHMKSFGEYETQGIKVPSLPAGECTSEDIARGLNGWVEQVAQNGTGAHGNPFVALPRNEPSAPKLSAGRVYLADSWRLGKDPNWEEPLLKVYLDNSVARPPFARLIDATMAFYDSRFEAFQNVSTRSLWNLCRTAFGLSHTNSLLHWAGTGPDAVQYQPTRSAHRRVSKKTLDLYDMGAVGEACSLIRDTDKAVRGFLAMARRETDGMWTIERTLLLTDILATFLTYVNLHGVFNDDDYLAPRFVRAEQLARSAALAVKQSKAVEDAISNLESLNECAWTLYGGSYLNREGAAVTVAPKEEEDVDDGGWTTTIQNNPIVPTDAEARTSLEPLLAPLALDTIKQVNFMPYARRRVSAVFPPGAAADGPAFMKTHYRLRTVPAPWTAEEQWRDHRHGDDPDDDYVEENKVVFEKELATLAEPAELDIWINPAGLEGASADSMVSLGLRARWAELSDGTYRWWIVRLKDYVLPAFWKSTDAERQAFLADPKAPYPGEPTLPAAKVDGGDKAKANGHEA